MYRFFDPVIRPIMDAVQPNVVTEIGSDRGPSTELLADWCKQNGATLHSIDPFPKYDAQEWVERWGGTLVFHEDLSLNVLGELGDSECILIDGDHNWYTVFHELEMIGGAAAKAERNFPLTFLHDVSWPYGRRDLYYDPSTIPDEFLLSYQKGGLVPGDHSIREFGFNDHLNNAVDEGTPRNGVLTAVEDYLLESEFDLKMMTLQGLHGLGIVWDASEAGLTGLIEDSIASSQGDLVERVEADRLARLLAISEFGRKADKDRERIAILRASVSEMEDKARLAQTRSKKLDTQRQAAVDRARELQSELERARQKRREATESSKRLQKILEQTQAEAAARKVESDRDLAQAKREYQRLRNRRSVRAVLRLAKLAKPLFRFKRRLLGGRRSGPTIGPSLDSRPSSGDEWASNVGLFYDWMRSLAEHGASESFLKELSESEERLEGIPAADAETLVSVIMPTFNRADIIGDAITSCLEQTYGSFELLICDDASDDDTRTVVESFSDSRIHYLLLAKGGAAAARNAGLAEARGELITYLDSDNIWHPRFLETMVASLQDSPGSHAAYSRYVDINVGAEEMSIKKADRLPFDFERLSHSNFIDLNTFIHRRIAYDHFGGFDTRLSRQQDWDLILRYTYLRDPVYVDCLLVAYRRNPDWRQITSVFRHDKESPELIRSKLEGYYRDGLPTKPKDEGASLTVVSWDISRNHFSKAYNIAESLQATETVQLLGFQFFEDAVFPPYATAQPSFATTYLHGGAFPAWLSEFARGVGRVRGDIVYAVKPRLPSLGLALLANYHFGKPVVLEINDLESVVGTPEKGYLGSDLALTDVDLTDPDLLSPYGESWTRIMEGLAQRVPLRVTHNSVIDEHFGGGAFWLRNLKNELHYDPELYDRESLRAQLGFKSEQRVILFGGMVRKHKGVFELLDLLDVDPSYQLLVVGSRESPDQRALQEAGKGRVTILEPVDRNEMARINLAADAVVLWLNPEIPAGYYQMPFKLTDALAMKVPVIANDIGDLGELGRSGYLRLAPFGDASALASVIESFDSDPVARNEMVDAGRRLYLRQFSYSAGRANLGMIVDTAGAESGTLDVAREFAEFFAKFSAEVGQSLSDASGSR